MPMPTDETKSGFSVFRRTRNVDLQVPRQPRIPPNAAATHLLSTDATEISGLLLAAVDDPAAPATRRVALAEEFVKQGQGERVPPVAFVEWYVAAQRVLRALDGRNGAPPVDAHTTQSIRWAIAHFAARAGLAADCDMALASALGGPVGTIPVPVARLGDLTRWQASHPAVLNLLLRALQANQEPDAEHKRSFLRDQLARQSRTGRPSPSQSPIGSYNV